MAELSIDTSDRNIIKVGIDGKVFEEKARVGSSQKLLLFIDELFQKKKLELKDIKEIKVNVGPGSFTGLRVGVSVAQTLGWSLGIKVNGKRMNENEIVPIVYK